METKNLKEWKTLYKRDSTDSLRTYDIKVQEEGSEAQLIQRTGLYDGKKIETIRSFKTGSNIGRSNEKTPFEVAVTEAEHRRAKKMDKGYKEFDSNLSYIEVINRLPLVAEDSQGRPKPMLAKTVNYNKIEYPVLVQPKLNGVRCLIGVFDGKINAISRGAKDYNVPAAHIIKYLEPFFEKQPELILDGELYIHGVSIQRISGLARTKQMSIEHQDLEYFIYDVAVPDISQEERFQLLNFVNIEELPTHKIHRVSTHSISTQEGIKKMHDIFVRNGYEGAIVRHPNSEYGFDKRDWRMQKVKEFIDEEFTIIGGKVAEGVSPEDSFVFELVTKEGQSFYAKPKGTADIRRHYANNLSSFVGLPATVRFFEWTDDKKPFHGHVVAIRNYE